MAGNSWQIKGGFANDTMAKGGKATFTDDQFHAELAKIERELVASGKSLTTDAMRDEMKRRREKTRTMTDDEVREVRRLVTREMTEIHPVVIEIGERFGFAANTIIRCARGGSYAGVK